MEVIQKQSLDFNSNLYKDSDYWSYGGVDALEPEDTVASVALHLEGVLRAAKKAHLACGEVLLPPALLTRVANDVLTLSDREPCGLRGALILLHFQQGPTDNRRELTSSNSSLNSTSSSGSGKSGEGGLISANVRNIGRVKWDPQTVTTFELHLTLKEDPAPWYSRLPRMLRNLTKGGTIVVSPGYTIAKKKLYRSH